MKTTYISSFSGIRVFLILSIFICHWVSGFGMFVGSFLEHAGFAVVFFFVLSGYLICNKYNDSFCKITIHTIKDFVLKHTNKLYVLYIITSIFSIIILFIYSNSAIFENLFTFGKFVLKIFLNVFLLQSLVPTATSVSLNAAAWFFSCLTILYAITPFLIKFKNRFISKNLALSVSALILCIIASILLQKESLYITPYYRIFQYFAGMLVFDICKLLDLHMNKILSNIFEIFVVIFSICAYCKVFKGPTILYDLLSACMFVFIFSQETSGVVSKFLSLKPLIYLNKFISEVFLIHFPLIVLFSLQFKSYLPYDLITFIVCGLLLLLLTFFLSFIYKKMQQRIFHN